MSWDFLTPRAGDVFPVVVASMGGAFSPEGGLSPIDEVVAQLAPPDNRLLRGRNWRPRLGGHRYVDTEDARELLNVIRFLARGVPSPGRSALLVAGKSSGGILAWNTFQHYYRRDIRPLFERCALVLVDPHGAVSRDGSWGPYCASQPLEWVSSWSIDRRIFRVYNVYQQLHPDVLPGDAPLSDIADRTADTLTGARFAGPGSEHVIQEPVRDPPNVVLRDREDPTARWVAPRLQQSSELREIRERERLHHMVIVHHPTTHRMIQMAFRFAHQGL